MAQNFYNAGEPVIQAYLQGTRLKQAREEAENEMIAKQIEAELRQQQIDQAIKKFEAEHAERIRVNDSKIAADKAKNKYQADLLRLKGIELLKNGKFKTSDGQEINVGEAFNNPDYFNQLRIPTAEETANLEVETAGKKERAVQEARSPFTREQILLRAETQAANQLRQQQWLTVEKQKDRDAARERTLANINARMATASMDRDSKKAIEGEAIDAWKNEVFDGSVPLEDLPKGQEGLKLQNQIRNDKVKIITRKERENLAGLKSLEGFFKKISRLNELLQTGNILDQATSAEIAEIKENLEADLVVFGRNAKEEKGVVSDRDIVRLRGAIPAVLPGGMRSLFGEEGRKKANQKRVDEVRRLYFEKVEGITKNMSPTQRQAIENRWELMPRVEKIED